MRILAAPFPAAAHHQGQAPSLGEAHLAGVEAAGEGGREVASYE